MLVLTRTTGQSIYIGKDADIKVKILTNDGQHVRIGLEAPKEILINREELHYEGKYGAKKGKYSKKEVKSDNTAEVKTSATE